MRIEKGNRTLKMNIIGTTNRIIGSRRMFYLKGAVSILVKPYMKIKNLRELRSWYEKDLCVDYDCKKWRNAYRKLLLLYNQERYFEMVRHFYNDEIVRCKRKVENDNSEIVVVCAVKNDLLRVQAFLEHYKNLGIKKFLFIDNGSNDGTYEFLMEQPEVELYLTNTNYNSVAKTAWINRLIAWNGLNKWYLVVDSDEFFQYPEMEEVDLNQYVKKLGKLKIYAVKALMIEPYPKGNVMDKNLKDENFLDEYCYFDGNEDSYYVDTELGIYGGGMHERLFGLKKITRTKIPLIYCTDDRFEVGSHDIFPLHENISAKIGGILMHYKFLPSDGEKIKKIIKDGNYANGSRLYKKYDEVLSKGELSAYYEGSKKWLGAESFRELPFVERCTDNK